MSSSNCSASQNRFVLTLVLQSPVFLQLKVQVLSSARPASHVPQLFNCSAFGSSASQPLCLTALISAPQQLSVSLCVSEPESPGSQLLSVSRPPALTVALQSPIFLQLKLPVMSSTSSASVSHVPHLLCYSALSSSASQPLALFPQLLPPSQSIQPHLFLRLLVSVVDNLNSLSCPALSLMFLLSNSAAWLLGFAASRLSAARLISFTVAVSQPQSSA